MESNHQASATGGHSPCSLSLFPTTHHHQSTAPLLSPTPAGKSSALDLLNILNYHPPPPLPPPPLPFSKNSTNKLVVLLSSYHCCRRFLQNPNPTASSPEDVGKSFLKGDGGGAWWGFAVDLFYSDWKRLLNTELSSSRRGEYGGVGMVAGGHRRKAHAPVEGGAWRRVRSTLAREYTRVAGFERGRRRRTGRQQRRGN